MHYSGGMCSQKYEFLDPCITMEEYVANLLIFWTHALQWRNVKPKIQSFGPMNYNGGMCSQYINFLDTCITVEECVAQKYEFLDPCITMEKCVANLLIFWTHSLQWRNV